MLLYGFGSKRPVLSAFMTYLMEADSEAAVVEVLGYSPHFTMKEVRQGVLVSSNFNLEQQQRRRRRLIDWLIWFSFSSWVIQLLVQVSQASGLFTEEEGMNVSGSKKSISTLAKRIIGQLRKSDRVIMLFVNNIEGQNLRNDDCQGLIAKLAELPNVYLVATADNAFVTPLLWNQKVSSQLNFHYYHVPTYCSYEDELMYQDDIAFQENDGRRLQAASVVLSSLTQTARTVFRQLAEYQLSDHPGGKLSPKFENQTLFLSLLLSFTDSSLVRYAGLPFSALFTVCREQLILSNEITLRSHLEEFIDHDLVCLNDASHENLSLYKIPLRTGDIERLRELCI